MNMGCICLNYGRKFAKTTHLISKMNLETHTKTLVFEFAAQDII